MVRHIFLLILLIGTVSAFIGSPGDGDDTDFRGLVIEFSPSCDENIVVVKDQDGDPVNQAEVDVFDDDTLENILYNEVTNESGIVTFEGCGKKVRIIATKDVPEHQPYNIIRDLVACDECGCKTDEDCLGNETCVETVCVPVDCECGEIIAHVCLPFQCCSDGDCLVNQTCVNNTCEDEDECTADSDCGGAESCSDGKCKPVTGTSCGNAVNHTWVEWECDRDCPCPAGEFCIEHECYKFEIDPEVVDEEIVVGVPINCRGCGIEVVDPAGDKSSYLPDANGTVRIPVERSGRYLVALAINGTVFDKEDVDALLLNAFPEEEKDFFQSILDNALLWIALLVAILIIALLYMISRHREEAQPKD